MTNTQKFFCTMGVIASVIVGIIVIPKVLKKITGKIYKCGNKDIDIDNMGPEIVKKDTKEDK